MASAVHTHDGSKLDYDGDDMRRPSPLQPCDSVAFVVVEAEGALRLLEPDRLSEALELGPEVVARSDILSNIADTADEGEVVPLPITHAMAALWLAAVAAGDGSETMDALSMPAQELIQTLAAADAMADGETVEKVCAAQRSRVRGAAAARPAQQADASCGTSSGGLGRHHAWLRTGDSGATAPTFTPADHPSPGRQPARVRVRKTPSALRQLLCCGRPDARTSPRGHALTSKELLQSATHDTAASGGACKPSTHGGASLQLPELPRGGPNEDGVHTGTASCTRDEGAPRECVYSDEESLQWLEQVVSGVSTGVALKLMHAAFRPASGLRQLQPLLEGKPAHLQALAVQACTPCIDSRREFEATVRNPRHAQCAADVLPHLPGLKAVRLWILSEATTSVPQPYNAQMGRLMHAACSPAHLTALQLTLVDSPLTPHHARTLTQALSRTSELETLQIVAGGCDDLVAAAGLARRIGGLRRLSRLELDGKALVQTLAVTLAASMTNLTALRELHLDDGTMPYAHTAAVARAAATLPRLTSLYFGGVSTARRGSAVGRTEDQDESARAMVSAVCTAPQLRALSIYEGNPISSSWCRLGRAMEAHALGYAQLTSLSLVRSVRCEDMLGLGRALACMPHLETLVLVLAGHEHGVADRRADACDAALPRLLRGLSAVTRLTALVLAGVDVVEGSEHAFARTVTRLPSLQKLVLSDAAPSGHTWAPAAGALATAMASGTQLTALRELYLLSWRVDGDAMYRLGESLSGLHGLNSLNFAVTDCRTVDMAALSAGLQCMTGLQQLYLRGVDVTKEGLCALAPALQELTALTELRLQYEELGEELLWEVALALVVPWARSALGEEVRERAYTCAHRPAHRAGAGPGLLALEVLDVGRCRLEAETHLEPGLLRVAVGSMPRLREVRVGKLLGPDLAAFSDWPVKVTGKG